MAALLVFLPLLLMLFVFRQQEACVRTATMLAAVLWGLMIAVLTEFLSAFSALNFESLLVAWGLVVGCCLCILIFGSRCPSRTLTAASSNQRERIGTEAAVVLGFVTFVVGLIGILASIAPPNTQDSMIYHMARVVHWIQNETVSHYPTHTLTQLFRNPWAEFAVTHLQILAGGDRLANMVQFAAMLGSLVGVSLIAKELGTDILGQVVTVGFVAAMPMGILQSSGTQTDYVASFWLVAFCYFGLLSLRPSAEQTQARLALALGASLGLAFLSKAYTYLYATPFVVWFFWENARIRGWKMWKGVLVILLIALLLNSGHCMRNLSMFGSPVSPLEDVQLHMNDVIDPGAILSNVLRSVTLQLGTPFNNLNDSLFRGVVQVHSLLGLDVNDPGATFQNWKFMVRYRLDENNAGNPLHFLVLAACFLSFSSKRWRANRSALYYACSIIVGFSCCVCSSSGRRGILVGIWRCSS